MCVFGRAATCKMRCAACGIFREQAGHISQALYDERSYVRHDKRRGRFVVRLVLVCRVARRFHAVCVARHWPVNEALAHLNRTGDMSRLSAATCPLCRRHWPDSAAEGEAFTCVCVCVRVRMCVGAGRRDDPPRFWANPAEWRRQVVQHCARTYES